MQVYETNESLLKRCRIAMRRVHAIAFRVTEQVNRCLGSPDEGKPPESPRVSPMEDRNRENKLGR